MNRNYVILLTLFFVPVILGLSGCAKKEAADTPFTRIQGKWKKVQWAIDDNLDNQIENSEIHQQPPNIIDEIVFNGDLSGLETINNTTESSQFSYPFVWRVLDIDSVWVAYKFQDTSMFYLNEVNSTTLQLMTHTQNNGVSVLTEYFYAKN